MERGVVFATTLSVLGALSETAFDASVSAAALDEANSCSSDLSKPDGNDAAVITSAIAKPTTTKAGHLGGVVTRNPSNSGFRIE